MNRMRIAFFLPTFPELSETFILRQITGLMDLGHDVRIFAHHPPQLGIEHPQVRERSLLERTRYLARGGAAAPDDRERSPRGGWAHVSRFPAAAGQAMRMETSASVRSRINALYRVSRLTREAATDVVHCHYGEVGLQYGFAGVLWRRPLVVSFYGYDCSSFPRRFGTNVYSPLFRAVSKVTVLSREMRDRVLALGCDPEKIAIQPLSVDLEVFQPGASSAVRGRGVRVLTVARFVEKKGIEYALRAMAPLLDEYPELEYTIVGQGPLENRLKRVASGFRGSDRVRFVGARAQPEVSQMMRDADIFLLPSVTAADGDSEGTPTVILEAAASGLPVVSTFHSGIPELVSDGVSGLLAPERDVGALEGSLRRLIVDVEERLRMGGEGRRFVESRHGVVALSADLEGIYRSVLPSDRVSGAAL